MSASEIAARREESDSWWRANAPVFVVGCPRSGTTLLYHMLLSSGRFARFRSETHVFDTLAPRFARMRRPSERKAALEVWLRSDHHILTNLGTDEVRHLVESKCHGPGDFLCLIMEAMCSYQQMPRWAETTPAHLLHMKEIRREIPNALFIHVLRDGRDAAASMSQLGWVRPWPFKRGSPVAAAAYWRWAVTRGRTIGRELGDAYCEVRYEDLLSSPVPTLARLSLFVGQVLDWDTIQRVRIGSVGSPNTSFPWSASGFTGRWQTELSPRDARRVDAVLAPMLRTMGYTSDAPTATFDLSAKVVAYMARFMIRDWLRRHTPLPQYTTNMNFFAPGVMQLTEEKLQQAAPEMLLDAVPDER